MLHRAKVRVKKIVPNNIRLIEISERNRVSDLLTPDIITGVSRGCALGWINGQITRRRG